MRFLLTHPDEHRPSLIVETEQAISPAHEDRLRSEMYERGCANGILFDERTCLVLRDTFNDMSPQSIRIDLRLRTDDVLSFVQGTTLDARVQTWLSLLSASWDHAIPADTPVADLIYDIVPAAAGTEIHVVESRV